MAKDSVILVDSTSQAMRVENILHRAGISSKLIPVPRHLSSDCGVCVRIASDQIDNAVQALTRNKVSYRSIEQI